MWLHIPPTAANADGGEREDANVEMLPPIGDSHPSGMVAHVSTAVHVDEILIRGTFQDADGDELPEEIFRGRGSGPTTCRRVSSSAWWQVVRYGWGGSALWAARGGWFGDAGAC